MATNPFAEFISGEALTAQPQLSYLSLLGDRRRSKDPSSRYEYYDWQGQDKDFWWVYAMACCLYQQAFCRFGRKGEEQYLEKGLNENDY